MSKRNAPQLVQNIRRSPTGALEVSSARRVDSDGRLRWIGPSPCPLFCQMAPMHPLTPNLRHTARRFQLCDKPTYREYGRNLDSNGQRDGSDASIPLPVLRVSVAQGLNDGIVRDLPDMFLGG